MEIYLCKIIHYAIKVSIINSLTDAVQAASTSSQRGNSSLRHADTDIALHAFAVLPWCLWTTWNSSQQNAARKKSLWQVFCRSWILGTKSDISPNPRNKPSLPKNACTVLAAHVGDGCTQRVKGLSQTYRLVLIAGQRFAVAVENSLMVLGHARRMKTWRLFWTWRRRTDGSDVQVVITWWKR